MIIEQRFQNIGKKIVLWVSTLCKKTTFFLLFYTLSQLDAKKGFTILGRDIKRDKGIRKESETEYTHISSFRKRKTRVEVVDL